MKKILILFLLFPVISLAQRKQENVDIVVTELSPGIHRLFVNNAVSVVTYHGEEGLLLIDAAYEHTTERLLEEINSLTDAPLKYLVNTHIHGDHTGGNKVFGKEADIIAHSSVKEYLSKDQKRGETTIPAFPEYALPNKLVEGSMDLAFNNEKIQITHMEGGHTAGDIILYFPDARVLVLGDLLFADYFPYVDTGNGGHPMQFMENVARILEHFPSDITVVGGHGPVYTMEQLKQWHQNLAKTIAVVEKAKENGMSQEEMKEERILEEWKKMGSFFITESRWIDTLYPYL